MVGVAAGLLYLTVALVQGLTRDGFDGAAGVSGAA
jgi:hypothetical protein